MVANSILIEFPVAGIIALIWPVAALVATIRAFLRTPASSASVRSVLTAPERTLLAGALAVVAGIMGLLVAFDHAMRKSLQPPGELFVAVLLIVNAVGLALAALPTAAVAARDRALGWRAWLGLLLAGGVLATVWGGLYTELYGSFSTMDPPSLRWWAVAWPLAAVVAHVALPRRGARAAGAGAALASLALAAALAAVFGAAWSALAGADDVVGSWLFPHHVGLLVTASISGLGALARDDRQVLAWLAVGGAYALMFVEAIVMGALFAV